MLSVFLVSVFQSVGSQFPIIAIKWLVTDLFWVVRLLTIPCSYLPFYCVCSIFFFDIPSLVLSIFSFVIQFVLVYLSFYFIFRMLIVGFNCASLNSNAKSLFVNVLSFLFPVHRCSFPIALLPSELIGYLSLFLPPMLNLSCLLGSL